MRHISYHIRELVAEERQRNQATLERFQKLFRASKDLEMMTMDSQEVELPPRDKGTTAPGMRKALLEMPLDSRLNLDQQEQLRNLLLEYSDIFAGNNLDI